MAILKAVDTPECNHDKKEDMKTESIVPVNCTTIM
jgi:hypothetical protein